MKTTTKRLVSIVLIIMMLMTSVPFSAMAAEESNKFCINVSQEEGAPGESVDVVISIKNNPGLGSLKFNVEYGDYLTLENVAFNSEFGSFVTAPEPYTNPQSISMMSPTSEITAEGTFATLTFAISEDAPNSYVSDIKITYEPNDICDGNLDNIDTDVENGKVTICRIPGDINGDDYVDNKDAILVFRHSAGWDVGRSDRDIEWMDVNADFYRDNKDAILIFRAAAGWPNVTLLPPPAKHKHVLIYTPAKESTCIEYGNIEYWTCDDCGKYFEDEAATKEIMPEDVVTEKAGHVPDDVKVCFCTYCGEELNTGDEHVYSKEWSNDLRYHWHAATCGHDLIVDKAVHNFDIYNECSTCGIHKNQLPAPVITDVERAVIYWEPVEGAESYQITASFGNVVYTYEALDAACPISALKDTSGNAISAYGEVTKIKVRANATSQYQESDWSEYSGIYYYVPATTNVVDDVKIGYGFDLIQNAPYNPKDNKGVVLIPEKISSAYTKTKLSTPSYSDYYSYSSVDEYMAKRSAKMEANLDVKIPVAGSLNASMNMSASSNYKEYSYNETFVFEESQEFFEHRVEFKNIGDSILVDKYLEDCLSKDFVDTIKGKTSATDGKSPADIAQEIYKDFGTHVAVAVIDGSSYTAQYVISTNSKEIAETAKMDFDLKGNVSVPLIADVNTELKVEADSESSWKGEETETHLYATWTGSTSGGVISPDELQKAIASWEDGINPVPEKFAKNGVIPISDLIRLIDGSIADAYDALINNLSNESYEDLCELYGVDLETRLVKKPSNGVLTIDLSAYSTLADVSDPCLREGEFTIHPTVYGQYIDTIIFESDFDEANEKQLIDSFSFIVPETWNGKELNIVFRNFGAVCKAGSEIVDMSALSRTDKVSVTYEGINLFKENDNEYLYAAGGDVYKLNTVDEELDLNNISATCLSVVDKDQHDFGGWYYIDSDGNEVYVTDSYGNKTGSVDLDVAVPTLFAGWTPHVYLITLDECDATTSGTTKLYEMYGVAFTYDMDNGSENAKDYAIENSVLELETMPQKTGYWLEGYYTEEDGAGTKCIDENGNIKVSNMYFKGNTTLYANWKPSEYTVIYDKNAEDAVGTQMTSSHTFNVSANLSANGYTRTGYTFAGWNTKPDGTGTSYDNEEEVINLATEHNSEVILYAVWTQNIVITLSHEDAQNKEGLYNNLYMPENKSGIYSDVTCKTEVNKVPIPARTGYTFNGYYVDETQVIDNNGTINDVITGFDENAELTASWTEHQYTVVFDANGGTCAIQTIENVKYSEVFVLPTVSKTESYKCEGWKRSDNNFVHPMGAHIRGITAEDGAIITFTAQWTLITCGVSFDANGGTVSPSSKSVVYKQTYGTLPTPTRTDYAFLGWYLNSKKVTEDTTVNTLSDHTLVAKWLKVKAEVDFNVDNRGDKEIDDSDSYYETIQTGFNIAELKENGYTKISFSYTFDCCEKDDGYQQIWVYNKKDGGQLYYQEYDSPSGWQRYNDSFTFNIKHMESDGSICIKYGADGDWWGDEWMLGWTHYTVTAIK